MSFGVGQSAITSVKSNRNLLSKRDRLKHRLFSNKTKAIEFNAKEITPCQLKRLAKKLKRDNRKSLINRLIVVVFIMTILVLVASYLFNS